MEGWGDVEGRGGDAGVRDVEGREGRGVGRGGTRADVEGRGGTWRDMEGRRG